MTPEEIVEGALAHGAVQDRQELLSLVRLLIERNVTDVLEIGTYAGGTLWCWCQIAKGYIASIDYGDVPRDVFQTWHNPVLLWTPKISSRDPSLPLRLQGHEYDFLFIDGGHSYDDARLDYKLCAPLVRKGGVIAFHDIALDTPDPQYQVKKFWLEIRSGKDYLEFDSGVRMGIGVLLV